jgi:hypothetical protein
MFWRISSFPELEHLSDENRREILHKARAGWRVAWLIIASAIAGAGVSSCLVGTLLATNSIAPTFGVVAFASLWFFSAAALYQIDLIRIRGQLRIYLEKAAQSQQLPLCLNCGYDITGLTGRRCPECGKELPAPDEHTRSM